MLIVGIVWHYVSIIYKPKSIKKSCQIQYWAKYLSLMLQDNLKYCETLKCRFFSLFWIHNAESYKTCTHAWSWLIKNTKMLSCDISPIWTATCTQLNKTVFHKPTPSHTLSEYDKLRERFVFTATWLNLQFFSAHPFSLLHTIYIYLLSLHIPFK